MPFIMDTMDALLVHGNAKDTVKRSYQVENFPNLSANVQKLLAHLPPDDDDVDDACEAEMTSSTDCEPATMLKHKSFHSMRQSVFYASLAPSRQKLQCAKSNESLDIISPNVQKMIANLQDNELVFVPHADKVDTKRYSEHVEKCAGVNDDHDEKDESKTSEMCDDFGSANKPLGNYMQKASGIASRTPVGRKNMGKYLQIPSESTNSTLSSEVSRPVSLTSLGSSSSSSSSSGLHQQGSAYLASAESLDSDNEPTGSQGSADSGIAESTTMGADMRVLQEVLDTEAIYVDDLHHVIKGYLEPWRSDPACPLLEHLADLFSNLEAIYEFNNKFLNDLRTVNLDATQIANVFLHHDSGFSIYTEYCTNYPRTMNILTTLTRHDDTAKLFRERQQALNHALPLGSYLLKPVQRILKYHLFLQRLSKHCDEHHKSVVDLALATMTAVATHINTMKRKHEHAVRVQEIQAQLYGWHGNALTALGELIAEGTFRVGGARGRRHVFLFDKLLMMAKSKPDGALGYKTHIMCSNLMLVEQVRGEPLSFHILPFDNPRNQYTLRARSAQHKREWTLQIKRVILENYNAVIPNHARQLVMQLGQDVQEYTDDTCDKSSPVKQHTTPQYLERRGRLRKTRDFSSTRRAASHDRAFPSLGRWRRQSDPSGCQQYKGKSPKAKKSPDNSVFYTDLSDSENCDALIGASTDSLNIIQEHGPMKERYNDNCVVEKHELTNTIAQVVSDLLMQDFHKVLNRQRRNLKGSHSCYANKEEWRKDDECLNKSDSLPRSFQLKESNSVDCESSPALTICESSASLQECSEAGSVPENDCDVEEDEDYPEHKIYRKSTMRFSLLQRFRAILSEDSKSKLPTYKQGSKSMGAKIAHPDYADPQRIVTITCPSAASSKKELRTDETDFDIFELPHSNSEMTINEVDVLSELDRRLEERTLLSPPATGPQANQVKSSYSADAIIVSSQNLHNGSSYYESLLDKRLTEEECKMEKSDSFRSTSNEDTKPQIMKKPDIRRPNRAPPPVPAKPKFLESKRPLQAYLNQQQNIPVINNCGSDTSQKGWVKTIIHRFE